MQVKFKKLHPDAVIPSYAKEGDAGMDLTAISEETTDGLVTYGTGITVEIPEGYVGLIFPRSSVYKTKQTLSNCVGVVDSGYRGEIKFNFYTNTIRASRFIGEEYPDGTWEDGIFSNPSSYEIGHRIGQLIIMPYPKIEPIEVDELSDSVRGTDGFGSSGK